MDGSAIEMGEDAKGSAYEENPIVEDGPAATEIDVLPEGARLKAMDKDTVHRICSGQVHHKLHILNFRSFFRSLLLSRNFSRTALTQVLQISVRSN